MDTNYMTMKVLQSIDYNRHKEKLSKAQNIIELKRIWGRIYYKPGEIIPEPFIKAAKLLNWEIIYKYVKS
jgi:hypothetical protein